MNTLCLSRMQYISRYVVIVVVFAFASVWCRPSPENIMFANIGVLRNSFFLHVLCCCCTPPTIKKIENFAIANITSQILICSHIHSVLMQRASSQHNASIVYCVLRSYKDSRMQTVSECICCSCQCIGRDTAA